MKPSKTSKAWMQEHLNDPYVKMAQKDGYRARAAYKLLEIDERDQLIRPGMLVVDLGAAPGSWSQVVAKRLNGQGRVIALDILPMTGIAGVEFIQGDFREESVLKTLENSMQGKQSDLVISDMAPNISGISVVDQAGAAYLTELALLFCQDWLKPGGNFLVKVFIGSGYEEIVSTMRTMFTKTVTRKPKASRDRSSEVYLLGINKKD